MPPSQPVEDRAFFYPARRIYFGETLSNVSEAMFKILGKKTAWNYIAVVINYQPIIEIITISLVEWGIVRFGKEGNRKHVVQT